MPPRHLNKTMPRDLETIILKAMSKDPGSRYNMSCELADDLRRFLADEPIAAQRPRSGSESASGRGDIGRSCGLRACQAW